MSSLAQLESDKRDFKDQLEIVTASLAADPNNAELQEIKAEIEGTIQGLDEDITETKAKLAPPKKAAPAPASADGGDKWSRENHPALKDGGDKTPSAKVDDGEAEPFIMHYNVNDSVIAKWISGDKGFYPAHITSITGSSTDPVFTVKFKGYKDTVETLRLKDIRPVGGPVVAAAGTKRKAEIHSEPAITQPPTASGSSSMPPAAPKPAEGGKRDKPVNVNKKIKPNKELEAGKNKWQEFNAKGKFKTGGLSGATKKKDSMFRTPEGVHGRVGFISSGKTKAKELTRTRNVYQQDDNQDNRD